MVMKMEMGEDIYSFIKGKKPGLLCLMTPVIE